MANVIPIPRLRDLPDVSGSPVDGYVLSWEAASGQFVYSEASADVGDLTTVTGEAGEMLRVAAAGGLEYRTPAQVLADIGAAVYTVLSQVPSAIGN